MVRVRLRDGRAAVRLPAAGTWYATLRGGVAPAALAIGDRPARGPHPLEVVQTADLSGRGAERCRAHAQGVALAVGRLNAGGGADGGRKVALRTEDDGGAGARAAAIV